MKLSIGRGRRWLLVSLAFFLIAAGLAVASPKKEAPAPGPAGAGTGSTDLVASPGVLVTGVQAGSPADKAGIVRGDIILEADGTTVNTPVALARAIEAKKSGDTIALKVKHGDTENTVTATLSANGNRAWLGIEAGAGRYGMMGMPGLGLPGFGRYGNGGPRTMLLGNGAYVAAVSAGGPAEKAGIVQGDFIVSVDGTPVDTQHTLGDLIGSKKPGDAVTLSVQSAGQPKARDVQVTLGKAADKDAAWLGVQYSIVGPRIGRGFGFGQGQGPQGALIAGVIVAQVASGSPAEKAGLTARDVITKVDGTSVDDPQQVADAVAKHKPGDSITVTVQRGASPTDITVTLGASPDDSTKAYLGVAMAVRRVVTSAPAAPEGSTPVPEGTTL